MDTPFSSSLPATDSKSNASIQDIENEESRQEKKNVNDFIAKGGGWEVEDIARRTNDRNKKEVQEVSRKPIKRGLPALDRRRRD